jgi:hypothetical protein
MRKTACGQMVDLVGRDTGRAELRDDELAMADDPGETGLVDAVHDLRRAEGPFPAAHQTLMPLVSSTRIQLSRPSRALRRRSKLSLHFAETNTGDSFVGEPTA